MEQLTRAARESGTAAVVITHDLRAAAYADRDVVIRDGLFDEDACAGHARKLGR